MYNTLVPNTGTASASAVELKMAYEIKVHSVFVLCFGSEKRGLLRKFKGDFALSIATSK
jgi:hypothetical protein